jgi:hypothetical protein
MSALLTDESAIVSSQRRDAPDRSERRRGAWRNTRKAIEDWPSAEGSAVKA